MTLSANEFYATFLFCSYGGKVVCGEVERRWKGFYKRKCTGCLTEKPNAPKNVCGHLRNPLSPVEA